MVKQAFRLVLWSSITWLVAAQVLRLVFPDQVERGAGADDGVAFIALLALVLVFAGLAAWLSGQRWSAALVNALTVTVGSQVGRLGSDFVSSWSGEPVGHDIWSGKADYWMIWLSAAPILLGLNLALVLALFLPVCWARQRSRAGES